MNTRSVSLLAKAYAVFRALVLTGIAAYLVWLLVFGWPAIRAVTLHWNAWNLALALVTAVLAYQCLFLGWLFLLFRTGLFDPRHLGHYSRIWWISYLYRYAPGKVLLLVERARLGTTVGIPAAAGAAFTIIETLLAIVAAAWVSLLAGAHYSGEGPWLLATAAVVSVAILTLLPVLYPRFVDHRLVRRRFPELSAVSLRRTDLLWALVPFVIHFLLLGGSFYLCASSLDAFSAISLPGLCGVYALSHVIGLVTVIAPGGLGAREGALAVQLSRVLPPGVAGVVAIGARLWFTIVEMMSLGAVLLLSPRLPPVNSLTEPEANTVGSSPSRAD